MSEGNRFSGSQEIPFFLQKLKGDYHVQRSPPLISIETLTNLIQTSHLFMLILIHFYIIFKSKWNSIVSTVTRL